MPRISAEIRGLDVYRKALKGAPARIINATDGIFKHDTDKSQRLARMFAGVKTGKLRSAIKTRKLKTMEYELYVDGRIAPHGAAQELGSKAHIIRPVRAKVLRFQVGGETVFSKKVRHPGSKGKFYLKRGLMEGFKGLDNRLREAYIKVFRRMGGK